MQSLIMPIDTRTALPRLKCIESRGGRDSQFPPNSETYSLLTDFTSGSRGHSQKLEDSIQRAIEYE